MKRNLLTSLLLYENVRTTKKRAAVVAPEFDKIVNYAKKRAPHVAIRYINAIVTDKNASKKIMEVFTKRFANVQSGMTRVKAAGFRGGDGAEVVDISLVEGEMVKEAKEAKAAKKPKQKKAPAKESAAKKPSTSKA